LTQESPLTNLFFGSLDHFLGKVRDEVSEAYEKVMYHGDGLKLGDLAREFEWKLSLGPYHTSRSGKASGKSWLEDYLLQLKLRQSAVNEIQRVQKAWDSLQISTDLSQAEKEVTTEVSDFLARASTPDFSHQFQQNYDRMTLGVISHLRKWPNNLIDRPHLQFPDVPTLDQFKDSIDWDKFALARAVQLKKQSAPEKIVNDEFLTVEEVIQKLTPDFDLEKEMHHYAMIKIFERLLTVVRREATNLLQEQFKRHRATLLDLSQMHSWLDLSFSSDTKQDIDWVEKIFSHVYYTTPTKLIEQLMGAPEDQIEIRAALDRNAESLVSLSESDQKALRDSSSDRQTFLKILSEIQQYVNPEDYNALGTIRKEIVTAKTPVDYAFVDAIFDKGIIDYETQSILKSSSRQKFLKTKFRAVLMSRFKKKLVGKLEKKRIQPGGEGDLTLDATAILLAQISVDQLDRKAKNFYLTPETFLNSEYGFEEALSFYDPGGLKSFNNIYIDKKRVFQAYVDGCIGLHPALRRPSQFDYSSNIDELLSQIKIPQFGSRSSKYRFIFAVPHAYLCKC
jgi:hypothetical protein